MGGNQGFSYNQGRDQILDTSLDHFKIKLAVKEIDSRHWEVSVDKDKVTKHIH